MEFGHGVINIHLDEHLTGLGMGNLFLFLRLIELFVDDYVFTITIHCTILLLDSSRDFLDSLWLYLIRLTYKELAEFSYNDWVFWKYSVDEEGPCYSLKVRQGDH